MVAFPDRIKDLRVKSGATQAQLAEALRVSQPAVSSWETGDSTPTIDVAKRIAEYFKVSLDWLVSDAAPKRSKGAA